MKTLTICTTKIDSNNNHKRNEAIVYMCATTKFGASSLKMSSHLAPYFHTNKDQTDAATNIFHPHVLTSPMEYTIQNKHNKAIKCARENFDIVRNGSALFIVPNLFFRYNSKLCAQITTEKLRLRPNHQNNENETETRQKRKRKREVDSVRERERD